MSARRGAAPIDEEEIELGDDEPEEQGVIVDLVPPDVGQKIEAYVEHYNLPEEAGEMLRHAPPFIALRVMTAMTRGGPRPHVLPQDRVHTLQVRAEAA